jgi:hypothetical protein
MRLAMRAVFGVLALAAFAYGPAAAEGFVVQPIRLEASVNAATTVELPFAVRNSIPGKQKTDLRLTHLYQTREGHWQIVEPGSDNNPHLYSALDWITLPAEQVETEGGKDVELALTVRVPPDARGTYFAALLAESPPPPARSGLVIRTRFLVPVILQIHNRPVRQQIDLNDIFLRHKRADDSSPQATTTAALEIVNKGRTFSRVSGQLMVDRRFEDRWRPVTRLDIAERGIVPGVTLELGGDLRRRLPSGAYRLRGQIQVDGRRARPMEKEIAFEGDPSIDAVAYDATLLLEPSVVRMNLVPGGTRTTTLQIRNLSEYPVKVSMEVQTPRDLQGSASGDLRGDQLSAQGLTVVRPAEFTLRADGRQNVLVVGSAPADASHPAYYANIVMNGTYADGQSAGTTLSTIQLVNTRVDAQAKGILDSLDVADAGIAGTYLLKARFVNLGDVHLEPVVSAEIVRAGERPFAEATLTGSGDPLLPLGVRTFGGEIAVPALNPGSYALRFTAVYGARQSTSRDLPIEIVEEATAGEGTVKRLIISNENAPAQPGQAIGQ